MTIDVGATTRVYKGFRVWDVKGKTPVPCGRNKGTQKASYI